MIIDNALTAIGTISLTDSRKALTWWTSDYDINAFRADDLGQVFWLELCEVSTKDVVDFGKILPEYGDRFFIEIDRGDNGESRPLQP